MIRKLPHSTIRPLSALALGLQLAASQAGAEKAATPQLPYGGQAVLEGVMMKGLKHAALAMRRRDGRIETIERPVQSAFGALSRTPFVRGFFILWDMMTLGVWAINESGKRVTTDEEAAQAEARGTPAPPAGKPSPLAGFLQGLMMVAGLIIAVLLFKVAPAAATTGIFSLLGWGPLSKIAEPTLLQQFFANLIEGAIKLGIFVGYVWGIGRLAEVHRVFEYHGAEHIVINAYEDRPDDQSIPFIQSHSVAHPRCGTSFIVILILASIFLFTALDWWLIELGAPAVNNLPIWWLRWPLRIVGLVPLAGISYEIIKAAFKFYSNPLLRPLLRFGMLFQALTTRRPSDAQVEVSLAAFNRVRYLTEGIPEPARTESSVDAAPVPVTV